MIIELHYKEVFDCELKIDDEPIEMNEGLHLHKFDIPNKNCNLKFMINPWKIQPVVRIDNILVNYGQAGITPWDHMLEINYETDFFDKYRKNIVKDKMKHYDVTDVTDTEYDYYIGVGNDHTELVQEIYGILKEKE